MASNITVDSHVWIEDPAIAWIDGIVLNITGDEAEVKTSDDTLVVASVSNLYPKDVEAPINGIEDMTKLSYLHEPGILHNLSTRFENNEIYTYTGNILIAVNPFQGFSHLYDADMMEKYKGATFGESSPHVFAIGGVAYREMVDEGRNNSILVSGESGSGKTETTKMLMHYLAYLGGTAAVEGRTVEQQVLESNPVLEAFGNAKTVRNNNSSRFGKFVEIQFDAFGRISGAAIRTYLLERSRVSQISDPERNYHCFYLLCAAPPEEIERYKLGDPKSFRYLNQSNCYELVGVDDANDYLATRRAMNVVGISEKEQDAIFRVVAAILHLGNVEFAKGEEADSSFIKDEKSEFHLRMTAELLMCDPQSLEDALCKRMMVTPEEVIHKSLDPDGAAVSRDGLARTIYSRLFDWLVDKINMSIGQDPQSKRLIGVLDIYGFESFETNSFEQLCINFTNEKLQQHFNQHVFKMEQEEYQEEEIDWSYVDFVDNQDVVDLIEKKPGGIISLLDEACMLPKSTPETFSQKLYQTFKDHKRFIKPKLTRSDFTIVHYAGDVKYQSDQFLDKNKDYVVPEHQDLLSASQCSFVAELFRPLPKETSKFSKFSSIGSRFKQQLQQLMETLNSMEPYYIRCVKPNNVLQPGKFENTNVLHQLRSGGVLEAIRVKCGGYPTRRTFAEFLARFAVLAPEILKGDYEENVACKWVLEKVGLKDYQIGKTKVFLRAGHMAELDAYRTRLLGESAKIIQGQIRTHLSSKHYFSMRRASIRIQASWRRKLARKLYKEMKRDEAATKIQKNLRRQVAKRAYNDVRYSALTLQTGLRSMDARGKFNYRLKTKAATRIQAYWRCYRALSDYKKLKRATIIYQSTFRGRMVRRQLGQRKMVDWEEEKGHERMSKHSQQTEPRFDEAFVSHSNDSEAAEKPNEACPVINGEAAGKPNEACSAISGEAAEKPNEACPVINGEAAEKPNEACPVINGEAAEKPNEACPVINGEAAEKPNEACPVINEILVPVRHTETIETLTAEVENLKALVQIEKQRADDSERKYAEAREISERRRKKLKETKRRVYRLQDSLNRLLYSMSDQFSQLKSMLRSPSVLRDNSENSDASSSDSDFTFPAPSPPPADFSTLSPNQPQVIVQDLSGTEAKGSEQYDSDKEGAFDDYF